MSSPFLDSLFAPWRAAVARIDPADPTTQAAVARAFDALVSALWLKLVRYLIRRGATQEEAEVAASQALLETWEAGLAGRWVNPFTVAYRRFIDIRRMGRCTPLSDEMAAVTPAPGPTVESATVEVANTQGLAGVIGPLVEGLREQGKLSDREVRLLGLRYVDELEWDEIAARLEYPTKNAAQAAHTRILARLRDALGGASGWVQAQVPSSSDPAAAGRRKPRKRAMDVPGGPPTAIRPSHPCPTDDPAAPPAA